ncbi:hypothetical protein PRUPE_6G227200 [Prunus persica]|uniref:Uncharacterized protein n=1 Tax=Prunus persica TaxID=3760 RepID=A0A251NUB1_PRUPE|nr:hypothetical protein PRUPE_6G227200 [Prunus persica]
MKPKERRETPPATKQPREKENKDSYLSLSTNIEGSSLVKPKPIISKEEIDMAEGKGLTMPKVVPLEAMCRARSVMTKVLS